MNAISLLYCYPQISATKVALPVLNKEYDDLVEKYNPKTYKEICWESYDLEYRDIMTKAETSFLSQSQKPNTVMSTNVTTCLHRAVLGDPGVKEAIEEAGGRCLINLYLIPKK